MPRNPKHFNVDNVRVVKIMGGSLSGSRVVQGMVFGRAPEGIIKKVTKAKVVVFTSALDIAQTETKGTVLIKNADEMLNFTRGEEKHMEKVDLVSLRFYPTYSPPEHTRSSKRLLTRVSRSSSPDPPSANSPSIISTDSTSPSSKSSQNSTFAE